MIERYEDPRIREIFCDGNKYRKMLDVGLTIMEREMLSAKRDELICEVDKVRAHLRNDTEMSKLIRNAKETERHVHHDVAAFVKEVKEKARGLSDYTGQVFKSWFHLRSTSSDLVDTALAMQLRDAFAYIRKQTTELCVSYTDRRTGEEALRFQGRTHGRKALPVTGKERWGRMIEDLSACHIPTHHSEFRGKIGGPVGSDYTPDEVFWIAQKVGLSMYTGNARQCLPRHEVYGLIQPLLRLSMILENHATNLRLWMIEGVDEYRIVQPGDYVGSSSMPYKNNPTQLERACGMARLVKAYGTALCDSINLWHERDISHSSVERVAIPDLFHCLSNQIVDINDVVKRLEVVSSLGREPTEQEKAIKEHRGR